jgi:streptogramin lyase
LQARLLARAASLEGRIENAPDLKIQFPDFHAGAKRYRVARSRAFEIKRTAPQGGHAMAASLPAYDIIPLPGEGPEDVVVGSDGLIYTGLLDGRILAVAPKDGAVREVAKTGGRPLGLEATTDGRLLICDSPKGLLG